ncbi:hypothetical protein BD779DRAFT_316434 [Infundibulicybe gibba]|nr:hypothetical protein BD779DRAFT_316434 [Infundibulicybe gibba]
MPVLYSYLLKYINPLHDQVSRETQLIECVKAFGANLLRDIDERKLELKSLLDRLDTLNDPGNQSTRGAPPTPTVVGGAPSSEPTEFSWRGSVGPSIQISPTSDSSDGTKHPYPPSSLGTPRAPSRLRVAIPATNIGTPIGVGPTTPQSRAVAQRRATPVPPADTITLVNPFTGQRWPLTSSLRQPHESDRPQNQVEANKSPRENPNTTPPRRSVKLSSQSEISLRVVANAAQEVIKEIYLLALLRLPPIYFVRVGRVIHDAELSEEDVEEISVRSDDAWEVKTDWTDGRRTKLATFKSSWESFASSLIKEWKTFNVVSVLLLSSVVAILQLQTDPSSACRISALMSLLSGLMSLLYGCLYIVRFGTMKKMYSAIRYVKDAERTNNSVFWNAWVLIAMPAVWLSWSIIFFFVCILSYVWQDQTSNTNGCRTTISTPSLPAQIVVSLVFSIGLVYFVMVVRVFNRYAKDGRAHSNGDIRTSRLPTPSSPLSPYGLPPTRAPDLQQPLKPFNTFKPLQNMNNISQCTEVPIQLRDRDTLPDDWRYYIAVGTIYSSTSQNRLRFLFPEPRTYIEGPTFGGYN